MSVVSPSELYQDPNIREQALCWREFWAEGYSLDRAIDEVDQGFSRGDPIDYLESFKDSREQAFGEAVLVLGCLPPQTLIANYGKEVLLWTVANTRTAQRADKLKRPLIESVGYDEELLNKAIELNKDWANTSNHRRVLSDYNLMTHVLSGGLAEIDLPANLIRSARPGVKFSDKRLDDYSLSSIKSDGTTSGAAEGWEWKVVGGHHLYNIHLDMPTGFLLFYKDLPQAVASFRSWGENGLMIGQMQGVKGKEIDSVLFEEEGRLIRTGRSVSARGLMPLDWQKLILNIVSELAKNMGKSSISIYASGVSTDIPLERAYKLYNDFAQSQGFTQGRSDEHWHKPLVDAKLDEQLDTA